jgi:hypothetical protein
MGKTVGDTYWASVCASAFPPQRTVKGVDTAQAVIEIGKWTKYYGSEIPVKEFTITDSLFAATSMMNVRVFAILRRSVRGQGVFVKRIRLPWPYVWTRKSGILYVRLLKVNLTGPKGSIVRKLDRAHAAYKKKSSRKKLRYTFGSFSRSPLRPTSVTHTSYVVHSTTNEHIDATNHTYTAPVFANPGQSYWDYERYYTGVRTPNFRSLKRGKLPENPYSLLEVQTKDSRDYSHKWDYLGPYWNSPQFGLVQTCTNVWNRTGNTWGAVIPTVPSVSDDITYNKAVNQLIASAESEISGNLAQDFAQFGQTTRLIANTATRIAGSISALKRGNFSKAIRFLTEGKPRRGHVPRRTLDHQKTLASNWLELQYGWKPLLQDIEGAMRSTAKLMVADTSVKEVRGSAQRLVVVSDRPKRTAGEYAPIVCDREVLTQYAVKLKMRYKVDDHLKAFAAQTGFTNPINLGWEILPYSFVVDWFLPIGPYLSALSAWDGLAFMGGTKTEFMKQYVTINVNLQGVVFTTGQKIDESAYYTRDSIRHNRVTLISFPRLRLPSLKSGVSVTHAANALALMTAAFK